MNDVSVKTAETTNSTDWKTTTLQPPVQNTLNVESARAFVVVYVLRRCYLTAGMHYSSKFIFNSVILWSLILRRPNSFHSKLFDSV